MTYLFSAKGRAELSAYVDATTLFAFDLDGTLAPIVPDPRAIAISDEVRRSLIQLNRIAPVAIVTGRSRKDALVHLGFTPHYLVGNHGAEGLPGMSGHGEDFIRLCQGWKEQLEDLLPAMTANGIYLEEKGETMSLHYRQTADPLRAHELILGAIARLTPLPRRVSGKFVENLAPQAAANKGMALLALMKHHGSPRAIFMGDDVTDEDVFRLNDPAVFGILVGKNKESAARFYLQGQEEMGKFLGTIIVDLKKTERTQTGRDEEKSCLI